MTKMERGQAWAAGVHSAGPTTVQGTCSCGWRGPERGTVPLANRDVDEHLADPVEHTDAWRFEQ